MAKWELCGNDYDKAFTISQSGKTHVFDSFECAIQVLAPTCAHCGCRIIGHGLEDAGVFYCCVHCAKSAGVASFRAGSRRRHADASAAPSYARIGKRLIPKGCGCGHPDCGAA
jgi:hypothetical protein